MKIEIFYTIFFVFIIHDDDDDALSHSECENHICMITEKCINVEREEKKFIEFLRRSENLQFAFWGGEREIKFLLSLHFRHSSHALSKPNSAHT